MPTTSTIQTACTKNRAEEFGFDVWEHFVIPFFFDSLDLEDTRKPSLILGGRGCGKTMLLRYLSHDSVFSTKRPAIAESEIARIGLYWKADTHFANAMTGRGIPDHTWDTCFQHRIALVVSAELLRSLRSLANSRLSSISQEDVNSINFDSLSAYGNGLHGDIHAISKCLRQKEREFQLWVNNPVNPTVPCPAFLPGRDFLISVIEEIQSHLPQLARSTFFVYVDEFENLLINQRRIINTCLKHSESPLIFNVAMKKDPLQMRETAGTESLENVADYRIHDLDRYLSDPTFPLFAAELLFFRFAAKGVRPVPVSIDALRDSAALPARRTKEYADRVLGSARRIFPGYTYSELADIAFSDSIVKKRLTAEVDRAIRARSCSFTVNDVVNLDNRQAAIVTSSLLYRSTLTSEEIAREMKSLQSGGDNRYTGSTGWIHNNFIGCLLRLYSANPKLCPFYAGFDTFIQLARGNLRHFLELCHMSLKRLGVDAIEDLQISPDEQTEAARYASSVFLSEVRGRGPLGNQLHSFVLTLGSLFAIAHQRPSQSEPEISHFSIVGGKSPVSDSSRKFLVEAVKWSVLFEERETKLKDPLQGTDSEWILNPIYAPYFKITYRKKRKLEISADDLAVLISGTYEERRSLLRRYSERWEVVTKDLDRPLFSHLNEASKDAD